ncbi:MAG: hypothetical protein K2X86_01685 [Cytophagaceae bacterium]|nr:hypothetical protein [Cytophagaceae bacterium]
MQTIVIVFHGVLIFFFLLAGSLKLIFDRDKIIANGGAWAEGVSALNIKIIGMAEGVLALTPYVEYSLLGFALYYLARMCGNGIDHDRRNAYTYRKKGIWFFSIGHNIKRNGCLCRLTNL